MKDEGAKKNKRFFFFKSVCKFIITKHCAGFETLSLLRYIEIGGAGSRSFCENTDKNHILIYYSLDFHLSDGIESGNCNTHVRSTKGRYFLSPVHPPARREKGHDFFFFFLYVSRGPN